MTKEVRTRIAPSPTGFLHIGTLRTVLFNYLLARKNNGKFILRIEDTDKAREIPGALENILQSLDDFKLSADEGMYWDNGVKEKGELGPYRQSERKKVYHKYAQELIEKKVAYHCFCSSERLKKLREEQQGKKLPPKYDKLCLNLGPDAVETKLKNHEAHVIRMNVQPGEKIIFEDLLHGKIEISSDDVDDQVLLKSDGFPTYHLAVVVDDHLMGISHVLRGEEWISSTPKHVLLYRAFGWEVPKLIHLPLLLSKSRKKLSKREGDVAVKDFLIQGYLPQAIINFVAFLGWNPKTKEEIFNIRDLEEQFAIEKLNKAGSVFDIEKLDWFNAHYIREMDVGELTNRVAPYLEQAKINTEKFSPEFLHKILTLERERLKKLFEIGERVKYFFDEPEYESSLLIWKKTSKETILKNLQLTQTFLQAIPENKFKKNYLEEKIKQLLADKNLTTGEVLWPLRASLTGLEASPGPFEIMDAFGVLPNGKQIILRRVNRAIEKLF
jgi:glutamyl-tRNA synthetase